MYVSEREIEAAEASVQLERDTAIARIQNDLASEGEDVCVDCDDPIGAARKAALPSAERCISCQAAHEKAERRDRGY